MEPFGVDGGIEALDVTPSRMLVRVRLIVGSKAYSHYVVRPEDLFYGSRDGGLRFVLGEVVDD
jgi:hypothetical protein